MNVLSSGGAQRRIATLANRMAELGRRVDVVSVNPGGPMRGLLSHDVGVVELLPDGAVRYLSHAVHAMTLARHLDETRPQALMSCVTDTHLMAVAARAAAVHPTSLVLRASRHPYRLLPWWKSLLEPLKVRKTAWAYSKADAIVALSADGAAGMRRSLGTRPVRIETILNPVVGTTLLDEGPTAAIRPTNDIPLILGVGRLVEPKNFATLVRAFALLRSTRPARLALLGDGPERAGLERLAARLGVSSDVEFAGEVGDASAWMRTADLLVTSSLWEGLQATPVEAMAVGCPVVATDCPGAARETLEGGRLGRLVPVRRPDLMAVAMARTLDAPPDAMALARSAARFTPPGKAEAYLALFDDLSARARR
jgi:glycosyltransferase involved in cell wall biosynthesis